MFRKLLNWLFGKRSKKLSPRKKNRPSELVKKKTKSGTAEKSKNKTTKKRRTKIMADEKEVKQEKVETKEEKVETKENPSAEKETATKPAEEVKEEPKTEEVKEETKTEVADEVKPANEVAEVEKEPMSPALTVEDIIARLDAMDAKIDSVLKENSDLRNVIAEKDTAIANKDDELKGMRDRYETPNFGDVQKKGVVTKDKNANDSFEEYSRQFM